MYLHTIKADNLADCHKIIGLFSFISLCSSIDKEQMLHGKMLIIEVYR